MEQAVTFGEWLKERRRAMDLSREALAELVSCAPPTLAKIEQGTRRPSRELAALLLDALQIAPAEREYVLRLARSPLAVELSPAQSEEQGERRRFDRRLPAPPASLVGRAAELHLLRERLTDPACRVVTLVGYGGAGKSRLALEAAIELEAHFRDGAVWVELAAVSTAEEVAPAIAHGLGYTRRGAGPLDAEVLTFLRERHLLLVLDNLEHLPGAAPFLSTIVRGAPGLTLLLTSRRPLHLAGEWVVVLEGLPAPPPEAAPNLERYDAARLFLERAGQAGIAGAADPESRQAVAQICRTLEGFPLAIELAAAWSRVLSYQAIAAELTHSLSLLAAPVGGEQHRHGSMGAVFAQSWSLLGDQERCALAALAIFQGGFTREAAAQVAGASLTVLAALIDLSLIRRSGSGPVRYQMHELVRQYAAEHLDQAAEATARAAHAAHYTQLLATSAPLLQGAEQLPTLTLLDLERANIAQAWAWAADQGAEGMLVRSAPGLLLMHELRGRIREAANLFSGAVARRRAGRAASPIAGGDRALGVLCAWEGWARGRYGETLAGRRLLSEAVELLDGDDDLLATTGVLGSLGLILLQQGRYAEASRVLERSLRLLTPRGLHFFATLHSVFLLNVRLAEGDPAGAAGLGEQALAHSHAGGGPRARLLGCCGTALTAALAGRVERAQELAREALALAAAAHDPFGLGLALLMLGLAARLGGDLEEARYLLAESAEACANVGDRWNQGRALVQLGAAARATGDADAARNAWTEALRVTLDHAIDGVAMSAAVELAALRIADMPEAAYRLLAALRARPEADYAVRARCTAILAGATHSALHDAPDTSAAGEEVELLARFVARHPAIFAYA